MPAETLQFKTELKQLLHLIIHSLYSHKDIFLRELISNASDAIDRVRFQGLTNAEVLEDNADWKIKLIPDATNNTLTISDNGLGMSRESIVEHLGTIARSGTREFLESLKAADAKERPELIGQFGVGFYASFMVADKVTVISRMASPISPLPSAGEGPGVRGNDAVKWESEGQGDFTLESATKATRHRRDPASARGFQGISGAIRPAQSRQEILRLRRASDRHRQREGGRQKRRDAECP